jgi:type IX secretion system PorP/SprF family membrane protein
MYNRQLFNPAAAGAKDAVEFNLLYRTQYVDIAEKETSTQAFAVNMPLYAISSGIGIAVTNDFIGYLRTTNVAINYDYRKKFSFASLGIGVGIGLSQTGIEGDKLRTPDGGIGGTQIDPVVPGSVQNGISPDFAAGIYLSSDKFFAGVSMNHLYTRTKFPNTRIDFARNLIIMGGYDFSVGKHFTIMPSVMIKTDLKQVQTDLSFTMSIYRNILTGVALRGYGARSLDAAIVYVGAQWKGLRLVYSYDINTSYMRSFNTGSHELSLAYDLKLKKRTKTGFYYHNSRFL